MQQPSVGRIVHYTSYGTPGGQYESVCRAAIITAVGDAEWLPDYTPATVDLCVLNPEGMFFNRGVGELGSCGAGKGGTWHWPDRE